LHPSATIERIGKKYQWIAFHEFLAHLSDNCCYIDPDYADNSKYFGPWQVDGRNIDPTCWLRKTGNDGWEKWKQEFWWQPFSYPFYGESLDELKQWLRDEKSIPPFEKLLQVRDPSTEQSWLILKSFPSWAKEPKKNKDIIPKQDAWYRINSCIVQKKDVQRIEESLEGQNLCDSHLLYTNSTGHQGFLREYPWHPVYKDMQGWNEDFPFDLEVNIPPTEVGGLVLAL